MKGITIACILLIFGCTGDYRDVAKTLEGYPISRMNGWEPVKVKWQPTELSLVGPSEYIISGNSTLSVRFHIAIKLNEKKWPHGIDFIQLIQRRVEEDGKIINLIEIFPYFTSYNPNSPAGDSFESTFNENITSREWGFNYFRARLGDQVVNFTVDQRK